MSKIFKKTKAFTLIETLVAIAILMASIAGPMAIVNKSMRSSVLAKDKFIAAYLAEEAIELIKARRDYNIANNRTWYEGIFDENLGADQNTYIALNTTGGPIATEFLYPEADGCPVSISGGGEFEASGACLMLYDDDSARFQYGYNVSNNYKISPYERKIIVDKRNDNELTISAVVNQMTNSSDSDGVIVNTYTLTRSLFNK